MSVDQLTQAYAEQNRLRERIETLKHYAQAGSGCLDILREIRDTGQLLTIEETHYVMIPRAVWVKAVKRVNGEVAPPPDSDNQP